MIIDYKHVFSLVITEFDILHEAIFLPIFYWTLHSFCMQHELMISSATSSPHKNRSHLENDGNESDL